MPPRAVDREPLRIGVIGLGYWGPNYLRVLHEIEDVETIWACDVNPNALDLVRRRYHGVAVTTRVEDVFEDERVDAVVVATPTSTHGWLTRAALRSGKDVLCEKPLGTAEESAELAAVAEDDGLVLMVGHTFIYNPAVRKMRELITQRDVGRVLYCHAARTGLGPVRNDVNALWDLAPHDISILLYLLQEEPYQVAAHGASYLRDETEDVVFVTLRLTGGILANIHVSWLDPYKQRKLTVIGDRKMVVFDDVEPNEKLRIFDKGASYDAPAEAARGAAYGEYEAIIRDGDIVIPRIASAEPLKVQLVHFVECCAERRQPDTDGRFGQKVVQILTAASQSLRLNGATVDLREVSKRKAVPRVLQAAREP